MKKKTILEAITILLILLWCYSGAVKLLEYNEFSAQLQSSPLLKGMGSFVAVALPSGEILTAVLLLSPKTKTIGLVTSAVLLSLFTVYISCLFIFFSTKIPCSCSGIIEHLGWKGHLVFNLTALILIIIALRIQRNIYPDTHSQPKAGFA
jgi:hypothetical protein